MANMKKGPDLHILCNFLYFKEVTFPLPSLRYILSS